MKEHIETYGYDRGTPQRQSGDLEPRVVAVEQRMFDIDRRIENVAVNHERTLSWVKDLAGEMKAVNTKLGNVTEELYKLRECFTGLMGKLSGGAIVISATFAVVTLLITVIVKYL